MGLLNWFRRSEEPTGPWRVGERVLGEWGQGGALFPGTIDDFSKGHYHIRFDDGDRARLKAEQIARLEIQPGMRVACRRKRGRQFLAGTVEDCRGEKVLVRYDDGGEEWSTVSFLCLPPLGQVDKGLTDRLRAAFQAVHDGDFRRGEQLFSDLIRQVPESGLLYARRAECLFGLSRFDETVADCEQALKLDLDEEQQAHSHYFRGRAHRALKRHDQAGMDVKRAIVLRPASAEYHKELGDIHRELGRREQALESYSRSLKFVPEQENVSALMMRGSCYLDLERYDLAIADLTRFLELVPDRAVVLGLRAKAHFKLGNAGPEDAAKGVADFTRSLELYQEQMGKPPPYSFRFFRGKLLQKLGRFEEALADVDSVLATQPQESSILRDRAEILRSLGRPAEAETALRQLDAFFHQQLAQLRAKGAVEVTAVLVMANVSLFDPGSSQDSPCRVLITFDPILARDTDRLQELASWLFSFKNSEQSDPKMRYLAELTTVEKANVNLRIKLPLSVTDGAVVYVTDLWVYRGFWPVLHERLLPCLAEPGDTGQQLLLPPASFAS